MAFFLKNQSKWNAKLTEFTTIAMINKEPCMKCKTPIIATSEFVYLNEVFYSSLLVTLQYGWTQLKLKHCRFFINLHSKVTTFKK